MVDRLGNTKFGSAHRILSETVVRPNFAQIASKLGFSTDYKCRKAVPEECSAISWLPSVPFVDAESIPGH